LESPAPCQFMNLTAVGSNSVSVAVFHIYRDYPGILIVLIPFWSGMGQVG
jgi:hypothetical protein